MRSLAQELGCFQRFTLLHSVTFPRDVIALAEFAVRELHDRELRGRMLYVCISNCRLNTGNLSSRRGNYQGASRGGQRIWEVDTTPRNPRPRD